MRVVRYILILALAGFTVSVCIGQPTKWVEQPISGSVTVFYPAQPGRTDTAGQTIYFLNDGKDLMLATVAPIPASVLSMPNYQKDSVLNNFIQTIIKGATPLIYTDVEYKGIRSKFYKVRVDDDLNPIQGLIADSYNFIYLDTIYSFSYLRYNATDLYDYTKQRMFFDMIDIKKYEAAVKDSTVSQNYPDSVDTKKKSPWDAIWKITALASFLIAITAGMYWFQNRRKS